MQVFPPASARHEVNISGLTGVVTLRARHFFCRGLFFCQAGQGLAQQVSNGRF